MNSHCGHIEFMLKLFGAGVASWVLWLACGLCSKLGTVASLWAVLCGVSFLVGAKHLSKMSGLAVQDTAAKCTATF